MSAPDHFTIDGAGGEYAGRHFVMDIWGCDPVVLASPVDVVNGIRAAVEAMGATMLGEPSARAFPGDGGVTAFAILAESHLAVHTWPERGYVAADAFTCGDTRVAPSYGALCAAYGATRGHTRILARGYSHRAHPIPR